VKIKIREYLPDDKNFILTTMVKSSYEWLSGKKERFAVYYSGIEDTLVRRYESGSLKVIVACDSEDENFILGYAIYDLGYNLHYVFVKMAFRNLGISKMILDHIFKSKTNITVSFWTKDIKYIQKKYNTEFNRFTFFNEV